MNQIHCRNPRLIFFDMNYNIDGIKNISNNNQMSSLQLVWWHDKLFIPLQVFTYRCGSTINLHEGKLIILR
jgi:hypothetical protein